LAQEGWAIARLRCASRGTLVRAESICAGNVDERGRESRRCYSTFLSPLNAKRKAKEKRRVIKPAK